MASETYRNAPITEAALDIRIRAPKELTVSGLESLKDDTYPILHQRPVKIEFQVAPPEAVGNDPIRSTGEVSSTPLGFAYRSKDLKSVFQVRTDGFTHNRLAPYVNWRSFAAEARRLWQRYSAVARPEMIELLGLNYINQILIPDDVPFERYLRTYIHIPESLPQSVNTYSLNFQISWPAELGLIANVGQALGAPVKTGFATMVLSIQAFKNVSRPAIDVCEDDIWEVFEKLRGVKNAVFESCISDTVREGIR